MTGNVLYIPPIKMVMTGGWLFIVLTTFVIIAGVVITLLTGLVALLRIMITHNGDTGSPSSQLVCPKVGGFYPQFNSWPIWQ